MQHNISDSLSQVKSGTIFDNFLITDDVKEAEDIGNETWGVTKVWALLTFFLFCLFCACIKMMVINSYWLSPQEPEKKMKEEQDDVKRKEEEEKNKEQETGADEDDEDEGDEDENEIKEEPEEDGDEEETVPKDELWGGVIRDSFFVFFSRGFVAAVHPFPEIWTPPYLGEGANGCQWTWFLFHFGHTITQFLLNCWID